MSPDLDGKPHVQVAIVPYSRVNEGINLQSVVDSIIWPMLERRVIRKCVS
ncbi:hypothetical protein KTT_23220 [Tengunoibacter tsumagoiensis]|uniref:Uncharacterized protein n=1 Tax=Tengunoibacter tsumagoiensis TaxID=2014871 RepID=A0A402A038_9CHLR|nr:hypothetical protein KTT_23220 [Tengunoibacter tsumagoiensis]